MSRLTFRDAFALSAIIWLFGKGQAAMDRANALSGWQYVAAITIIGALFTLIAAGTWRLLIGKDRWL